LFSGPVHRTEMRRQHAQRRTATTGDRRRLYRAEACCMGNRAQWGEESIGLDVFDHQPLAGSEGPATGRVMCRRYFTEGVEKILIKRGSRQDLQEPAVCI